MAKLTLYEVLGVAEDADAEAIAAAYGLKRNGLASLADAEDRRNQLQFLDHAFEVLSDPGRRAGYDWQRKAPALPVPELPPALTKRQARWRGILAGSVALLATLLLGRLWLPAPRSAPAASPSPVAPVAKAAPAAPTPTQALPSIEDAAAALSGGDTAPAPAAPAPAAPPRRTVVINAGSPMMARLLQSTYAIVGAQGHGTGVAVEPDRLLTNCHVIAPNVLKGRIVALSPVTGAAVEITEAAFLVREDACVVHAPGLGAQPIPLGDTSLLQRGMRFHNIGFGGGRLTLAEGTYLGALQRFGQYYMLSTNSCLPGVSGGPLVDDEGRLIGLTSGGARDRSGNAVCASLTVETARQVLSERMMQINAFPGNYVTNWTGRR